MTAGAVKALLTVESLSLTVASASEWAKRVAPLFRARLRFLFSATRSVNLAGCGDIVWLNSGFGRDEHVGLLDALNIVLPKQCLLCGELVESRGGLCGPCWRDTPFILGLCCDLCGVPLPGEDPGRPVHCDDCRERQRPWTKGRAVMIYDGGARRLVLGLKHGDRLDLAPFLGEWMSIRAASLVDENTVLAPVPLHRWRLLRRRYNQAAALAQAMAQRLDADYIPDLLLRNRATRALENVGPDERYARLDGAITAHPARAHHIAGKTVLLVDDVMTSGATLEACAHACLDAGAAQTRVIALARAARFP